MIVLAVCAAAAIWLGRDLERLWNIILMLAGLGAVIFVHELGHFIAAKAVGIKVEGFSIGFGPVLLGFRRVGRGLRIRLLPDLLAATGRKGIGIGAAPGEPQPADTEYLLRLVPLGGFVKMLGQEDVAADKPSADPRAYPNKPVWQRMVVIVAGVTMNVIAAAITLVIIFNNGIDQLPAVVGDVAADSAAAKANLQPGDEIVAIDGKKNVLFIDLAMAAAFAGAGEKLDLTVRRDGQPEQVIQVEPEMNETLGAKTLGIMRPVSLTIANLREEQGRAELEKLGLEAGDRIVAVNGREISQWKPLNDAMFTAPGDIRPDSVLLTVEREQATDAPQRFEIQVPMRLAPVGKMAGQILGMTPRLRVAEVFLDEAEQAGLKTGDIVMKAGAVLANPTLNELEEFCKNNVGEPVELLVQRQQDGKQAQETLTVTPQRPPMAWWRTLLSKDEPGAVIGFIAQYDVDSVVVAAVDTSNSDLADLPRGATISSVDSVAVNNWADIAAELVQKKGSQVELAYLTGGGQGEQVLTVDVPDNTEWLGFAYHADLAGFVDLPLEPLMKLIRGDSLGQCLAMGVSVTRSRIQQALLTLKGLVRGTVSPKGLMGPVGILGITYTIAKDQSVTEYVFFLAWLSTLIAVFNLLPLPILDGGHLVFLLIEKIKGSPVPVRVQEITTYAGLAMLVGLLLFVSYNDVARLISGGM